MREPDTRLGGKRHEQPAARLERRHPDLERQVGVVAVLDVVCAHHGIEGSRHAGIEVVHRHDDVLVSAARGICILIIVTYIATDII
jgi:hypothetical protein